MSRFQTNINNQNDKSLKSSGEINWEVIKNHEYKHGKLFKVISLYILRIYKQKNDLFSLIDKHSFYTILLRINIVKELAINNRSLEIEIMKSISSCKFNSKKKNSITKLQDLSKYFNTSFNVDLPKEIEESFITEYKEAIQLLGNEN